MRSFKRREKGSVTIFICIISISIILLVCAVGEAVRIGSAKIIQLDYSYMAADSVMAGYARQIYEDYGVLLVWEEEALEQQLERYIQANIEMADLDTQGGKLLKANLKKIDVNNRVYATQDGGDKLMEQILSYSKYRIPMKLVEELISRKNTYDSTEKIEEKNNSKYVTDVVDEIDQKVLDNVEDINNGIKDIKDLEKLNRIILDIKEKINYFSKDNMSKKEKKEICSDNKDLKKCLEKTKEQAKDLIQLIEQYEKDRREILEYTNQPIEGDYMDSNKKSLEKIKDTIVEIEELIISDWTELDSTKEASQKALLEKAQNIEDEINTLVFSEKSQEDEENTNIYEQASQLINTGILALVVEDVSNISEKAIQDSNLPSNNRKGKNTILDNIFNKGTVCLYVNDKFGDYLSPREDDSLSYGMEYVLQGGSSDKDNLADTVEQIVLLRNVINFGFLLLDKEKMAEIGVVALSVATAMELPFLEPIIKWILVEAWALAEAISDVKILLEGEKVPFTKTKRNWNTSITNLMGSKTSGKSNKGMGYEEYLEILLLLEDNDNIAYRIMDLIEKNVQMKYNNRFRISNCFQEIDFCATYEMSPIFNLGALEAIGLEQYTYRINCKRQY